MSALCQTLWIMLEQLKEIAVLFLLSWTGYRVFDKFHCPAPQILGAMCFVMAGNLFGLDLSFPGWFQTIMTISVGIVVGIQFKLQIGKKLIRYLLISCSWLIATGLLIGKLLSLMGMDEETALFASLPGGIVELSFISASFSANAFQVTILHASRMITLILVMPILIRRLPQERRQAPQTSRFSAERKEATRWDWVVLVFLSSLCGILLAAYTISVGAFVGALCAAVCYAKMRRVTFSIPKLRKNVLESCVGGDVGTTVGLAGVLSLPNLLLPLCVLNLLIISSSLLLGRFLCKISGMDRVTAQLAAVPGGFSPFVMLAEEMGADLSLVSLFHLCRYMSMIVFSIILGVIVTL